MSYPWAYSDPIDGAGMDDEDRESWNEEDDAVGWEDDWEDDEDEWLYRCGWVRGQGCMMAGSEECDFECPLRADYERGMALTRARRAKRKVQEGDDGTG